MNLTRRGEDSSTDIEGQSTMVLQHGDEVYLNAEVSVMYALYSLVAHCNLTLTLSTIDLSGSQSAAKFHY